MINLAENAVGKSGFMLQTEPKTDKRNRLSAQLEADLIDGFYALVAKMGRGAKSKIVNDALRAYLPKAANIYGSRLMSIAKKR